MKKLDGKIAVITGGNSGIGLATAQRFVAEGAYVFITGRRQGELDSAVNQIGKNVTGVQGDVSNLADLDRLYAAVKDQKGRIDIVFANAGVAPTETDRTAAISEFNGASNTADMAARSHALRRVAENLTLTQREFNRAFVLMQYFGYLRRNPNDAPDSDFSGYNFWLGKLNQFGGNYQAAEMVKAFIVSSEYRSRFGSP